MGQPSPSACRTRGLALALLAVCATTGCLIRAGKLTPDPSLPAGPSRPLTAKVDLDVEYYVNDVATPIPASDPRFDARFREAIDRTVDVSGYFTRTLEEDFDVELLLLLENRDSGSQIATLLTLFTLAIFPSTSTSHYRVEAKARDPRSDRVWRSAAEESARRWAGLVFLPGSPFAWPPSVERQILEDLTRSVLRDLQRAGAFSAPAR